MKVLALDKDGGPLIVRGDDGEDYEIEASGPLGPRAVTVEDALPHVWAQTYREHQPEDSPLRRVWLPGTHPDFVERGTTTLDRPILEPAPLLVPAPEVRILTANHLPSLEQRALEEQRARSVTRLGGGVPVDPVVQRRQEALRRLKEPDPLDPLLENDVKALIDGLYRRPVL